MGIEKLDPGTREAMAADQDLRDFMLGENTGQGARYDGDPRGLTSDVRLPREEPPERLQEADTFQPVAEEPDWKRLYGQSENDKGTWRRTAEEALTEIARIRADMEIARAGSQNGPSAYGYQQYSQVPPVTQTPPIPDRFIPNKAEDDLVQVGEVEKIIREMVAPTVLQLAYGQQQLRETQLTSYKTQLGVTQASEGAAVRDNPWINSIQDPFARTQAIASITARKLEPARPAQREVEQAAARATFIEGTRPSTAGHETSEREILAREMAEAQAAPFGAPRREAIEKVFRKYGIGSVNDFGPDFWAR